MLHVYDRPTRRAVLGRVVRSTGAATAFGLLRAVTEPVSAHAAVPRLGFIGNADANQDRIQALKEGLGDLGYVDGSTVAIEWRFVDAADAHFEEIASELIALPVNLLIAGNAPAAVAAHRVTATLPIVMTAVNDPVGLGIASSLEHPGGNVTGTTIFAPQLIARRLDILGQLVPDLTRVGMLLNGENANNPPQFALLQDAAEAFGVEARAFDVSSTDDLDSAFGAMADWGAGGFLNGVDSRINSLRQRIAELAAAYAIPAIYTDREYVQAGGLLALGPGHLDGYRNAATYIDRILRGASPADLPIQPPTTFELVANRKAMAELGGSIPVSIAASITEWLE